MFNFLNRQKQLLTEFRTHSGFTWDNVREPLYGKVDNLVYWGNTSIRSLLHSSVIFESIANDIYASLNDSFNKK